ncbi:hypothetical protein [Halobacillus salinus]|uniref:Uncharacterized protein n=1 Tax=Halobacillus salinus TaxID=192814 RepID=A0A4Z0H5P8_9BACI|nr:hypothetical protein [Halobacillus salinus]TGB05184.1 hypothetical protein E4663_09395 [Halobacillus salinus]
MNLDVVVAAALGALGTIMARLAFKWIIAFKHSKQVKYFLFESMRRTVVLLDKMLQEEKQVAIGNMEFRMKNIRLISELLSEMDINSISTKDVYGLYRVRESIEEVLYDLNIFHQNYIKLQEFEVNLTMVEMSAQEKKVNRKELKRCKIQLDSDYDRLVKQVEDYIAKCYVAKSKYKTLIKIIYKNNKLEGFGLKETRENEYF